VDNVNTIQDVTKHIYEKLLQSLQVQETVRIDNDICENGSTTAWCMLHQISRGSSIKISVTLLQLDWSLYVHV